MTSSTLTAPAEPETAPPRVPPRVCLVTELLAAPLDEGMKVFTAQLVHHLAARCELQVLTNNARIPPDVRAEHVPFGKTLLSSALRARITAFRPERVVYVPEASLTTSTFARGFVLRRLCPDAELTLVGLQPRPLRPLGRRLALASSPLRLYVQSRDTARRLMLAGLDVARVSSGVDLRKFRPVSRLARAVLREKHGLPRDAFVVGHVGHLRTSRNLGLLAGLVNDRTHVILAASTSTPAEDEVRRSLAGGGVLIWDHFLGAIQELYQMCDVYVFPVVDRNGCIEVPLSMLEALACGVPVVSARFGDLERTIPGGEAVSYFDDEAGATAAVESIRREPHRAKAARAVAEAFGWDRVLEPLSRGLEVMR